MPENEKLMFIFYCTDCSKIFVSLIKWQEASCVFCHSDNTRSIVRFCTKDESNVILQNANVLRKVLLKKDSKSLLRRNLSIYRLYKANFDISQISYLLSGLGYPQAFRQPAKIQDCIGQAFKDTCLKSDKCWAKAFLVE